MDPNTAFQLVSALGSLASMVSAYLDARSEQREIQPQTSSSASASQPQKSYETAMKFAQALPKDIGDASRRRVEKVLSRYTKAIQSPMNPFDLDKETELAEWEICHILRLMKKHNRGVLPPEFEDYWNAFNCDEKAH